MQSITLKRQHTAWWTLGEFGLAFDVLYVDVDAFSVFYFENFQMCFFHFLKSKILFIIFIFQENKHSKVAQPVKDDGSQSRL